MRYSLQPDRSSCRRPKRAFSLSLSHGLPEGAIEIFFLLPQKTAASASFSLFSNALTGINGARKDFLFSFFFPPLRHRSRLPTRLNGCAPSFLRSPPLFLLPQHRAGPSLLFFFFFTAKMAIHKKQQVAISPFFSPLDTPTPLVEDLFSSFLPGSEVFSLL